MKLLIENHHFVELVKKSYSLDHVYLLHLINKQFDVGPLRKQSLKIDVLYKGLIRKGLITEQDKLTTLGKELLVFLDSKGTTRILKKKSNTDDFEEWWKAFPGTDNFVHKGKTFRGARTLRNSKEDCRLKFDKILLEGEYTAAQLTDALKYDVLQKKENSVITGMNKLSYMQNSLTYLNQRSYEPIIELINEGVTINEGTEKVSGSTDI